MSRIKNLIDEIARTADCTVLHPCGLPSISPKDTLTPELQEFYEICGGVSLFGSSIYSIEIVPPKEFVQANNEILIGATQEDLNALHDDISSSWYIIGRGKNRQYVTIDLGINRSGKCYDSFWDRYAMPGYMPVIANSFFNLLNNLHASRGEHWYWLQPSFASLGDAYD